MSALKNIATDYVSEDEDRPVDWNAITTFNQSDKDIKIGKQVFNVRMDHVDFTNEIPELPDIALETVIDSFIDNSLKKHNVDPTTSKFCFMIRHEDLNDGVFYLPYRTRNILNGTSIVNTLAKMMTSKNSLSISKKMSFVMHVYNHEKPKQAEAINTALI